MMSLVDEEGGCAGRHPLLDLRLGASGDLHRCDHDIGAVENLIHLGRRRWNVGEPHDDREGGECVEAFLLFENAKGFELACDLLAQCICGNDHQQPLEPLKGIEREHCLCLAGARRHDDGCRFGRAGSMCKRRMERADLRTAQPAHRRPTALGGTAFPEVDGVLPRGRDRGQARDTRSNIERVDVDWRKVDPSAFAKFKRLDDLGRLGCARHEQDEIGVQPRGRPGADDLQRLAGVQGRFISVHAPDRKGSEAARLTQGGDRQLPHRASEHLAVNRQTRGQQQRHLLVEEVVLCRAGAALG